MASTKTKEFTTLSDLKNTYFPNRELSSLESTPEPYKLFVDFIKKRETSKEDYDLRMPFKAEPSTENGC